jgi:hypothetical protein
MTNAEEDAISIQTIVDEDNQRLIIYSSNVDAGEGLIYDPGTPADDNITQTSYAWFNIGQNGSHPYFLPILVMDNWEMEIKVKKQNASGMKRQPHVIHTIQ